MSVELPPLPVPAAYGYEWRLQNGAVHRSFSAEHYNGVPCNDQVLFYTADQMHAYARAAVNAALERAAPECEHTAATGSTEDVWDAGYDTGCNDCADVIRALKTKEGS